MPNWTMLGKGGREEMEVESVDFVSSRFVFKDDGPVKKGSFFKGHEAPGKHLSKFCLENLFKALVFNG